MFLIGFVKNGYVCNIACCVFFQIIADGNFLGPTYKTLFDQKYSEPWTKPAAAKLVHRTKIIIIF